MWKFATVLLIIGNISTTNIDSDETSPIIDPDVGEVECIYSELSQGDDIRINVSEIAKFDFNCTCCKKINLLKELLLNFSPAKIENLTKQFPNRRGVYAHRIITVDKNVVIPLEKKTLSPRYHVRKTSRPLFQHCPFFPQCLVIYNSLTQKRNHFFLDANTIGRTKLHIAVIWWNVTRLPRNVVEHYLDDETYEKQFKEETYLISLSNTQLILKEFILNVTVVRKLNICNDAFNLSSAFIACLLALSVGCSLDITTIKTHFRKPKCLLLGLGCQYCVMPLLGLTIYKILQLKNAIGFGVFALACAPGGGLGHIIIFLMKGDEELSALISTINCLLNSGVTLLWMYMLQDFYEINIYILPMALWMGIIPIIQSVGVLIHYLNLSVAQAIMTWFTRPLLLLAGILFVTLGVYINHYAFTQINHNMLLGVLLLVLCGFLVGNISGYFSKSQQKQDVTCTLSVETALSSALILIPALRFSINQPEADLASSACLWSIFFSPLPLFLIYVIKKVQIFVMGFIKNQFKRKSNHYRQPSSHKSSTNNDNESIIKSDNLNQPAFKEESF